MSSVCFLILCLVLKPLYADCILMVAFTTSAAFKSGNSSPASFSSFLVLKPLYADWILIVASWTWAQFKSGRTSLCFFIICLVLKPLYADCILSVAAATSAASRSGSSSECFLGFGSAPLNVVITDIFCASIEIVFGLLMFVTVTFCISSLFSFSLDCSSLFDVRPKKLNTDDFSWFSVLSSLFFPLLKKPIILDFVSISALVAFSFVDRLTSAFLVSSTAAIFSFAFPPPKNPMTPPLTSCSFLGTSGFLSSTFVLALSGWLIFLVLDSDSSNFCFTATGAFAFTSFLVSSFLDCFESFFSDSESDESEERFCFCLAVLVFFGDSAARFLSSGSATFGGNFFLLIESKRTVLRLSSSDSVSDDSDESLEDESFFLCCVSVSEESDWLWS